MRVRIMKQFLLLAALSLPLLVFGQSKADGDKIGKIASSKPMASTALSVEVGGPTAQKIEQGFDRFKPVELKADASKKPRVRENEEELLRQKAKGPVPNDRYQPVR